MLWPVDDGGERLPVELSGLPVFDRDRQFRGYRGFGVCRDLDRINQLARARRERPIGFMAPPEVAGTKADAIADEAERAIASEPMPAARRGDATASEPRGQHARRSRQRAWPARPRSPRARCGAGCGERRAISHGRAVRDESAGAQSGRAQSVSRVGGGTDRAVAGRARGFESSRAPARCQARQAAEQLWRHRQLPQMSRRFAKPGGACKVRGDQIARQALASFAPALLDRLPLGVLIYRRADAGEAFLYANRYLLELSGMPRSGRAWRARRIEQALRRTRRPTLLPKAAARNRCRS